MTPIDHDLATRQQEARTDHIWTSIARNYGWNVNASLSSRLKADLVHKYLAHGDRLCDIGCANGLFLRVFAPSCAHATGVDLNATMLEEARAMLAREAIDNVDLVRASASTLPLPDQAYDVVICFSTLLLIPDVEAALRHMVRVLRPGGHLIVDVAGRHNLANPYWWLWYRRRGHFGIHAFTPGAIRRRLEALGCRVVESHAMGVCDQWKYVPGLHWFKSIDRLFHASSEAARNRDYRISNLPIASRLASRWYIVARKATAP